MIEEKNLRYKCNFCGNLYKKFSNCAIHLEKKSEAGIVFPSDILMVDITKEEKK